MSFNSIRYQLPDTSISALRHVFYLESVLARMVSQLQDDMQCVLQNIQDTVFWAFRGFSTGYIFSEKNIKKSGLKHLAFNYFISIQEASFHMQREFNDLLINTFNHFGIIKFTVSLFSLAISSSGINVLLCDKFKIPL